MHAFPAYFPLAGRKVVIVGSGEAAKAKARLLESSPAEIVLIDEDERAADPETYADAVLAFICVDDGGLAERAADAARAAHTPVNVVDRPQLSDFFTPAVIDRDEVVAAIGTCGTAPMLASLLRSDIEARVPQGAGRMAALLGRLQGEVRAAFPDLTERRSFLRAALSGPAAQAAMAGQTARAEALLREALSAHAPPLGMVRFIDGRGPSDQLSLAAARILAEADAVISDEDADKAIEVLARRDARRISPAEAPPAVLADMAERGLQVVRITGARDAGEEMAALTEAGVRAEAI
jgi:precorrin-2 dehydrogenase/sirohydrochlorin ferrochelatase